MFDMFYRNVCFSIAPKVNYVFKTCLYALKETRNECGKQVHKCVCQVCRNSKTTMWGARIFSYSCMSFDNRTGYKYLTFGGYRKTGAVVEFVSAEGFSVFLYNTDAFFLTWCRRSSEMVLRNTTVVSRCFCGESHWFVALSLLVCVCFEYRLFTCQDQFVAAGHNFWKLHCVA